MPDSQGPAHVRVRSPHTLPHRDLPRVRIGTTATRRATDPAVVMSTIALLVADGTSVTRPQLAASTALARTTIESNLSALVRGGIVVESGQTRQSRYGRPATALSLGAGVGVVLVAEVTPHHLRLVVAGLDQTIRAASLVEHDVAAGPDSGVEAIDAGFEDLLVRAGARRTDCRVLVVSVPGPVDVHRGIAVRPPIMPGWDEYPLADALRDRLGCPVLVDNDVNLMALGESRALPPDQVPLLMVKVGTGIGGGIVAGGGELIRGADGSAGDIGHARIGQAEDVVCTCGNVGCIEAVASLEAIARTLAATDGGTVSQDRVLDLVRSGDGTATRIVRDAAASIGEVVAALVHFFNPARIVLAGRLTAVSDDLLAGVRSAVYRRALPLATRNLTIAHSVLGADAGTIGGLVSGIEYALGPDRIEELRSSHLAARR